MGREHDRQLVLPIPKTNPNPNGVGQECPTHTGRTHSSRLGR